MTLKNNIILKLKSYYYILIYKKKIEYFPKFG